MPLDVLGCTRITMLMAASISVTQVTASPNTKGWGTFSIINVTGIDARNYILNEEFLVVVSHQLTTITSLLFVHTARRSYRWNEKVNLMENLPIGVNLTEPFGL